MSGFIAANLAIAAYNIIFVIGMMICMVIGIHPPKSAWTLLLPWIGIGAALYGLVFVSVNS